MLVMFLEDYKVLFINKLFSLSVTTDNSQNTNVVIIYAVNKLLLNFK
jgi:hypothetical protein